MSDLVGNPEARFSYNEAQIRNDGFSFQLIQKRIDGKVDFHRTYSEYERGFGNLTGEHWLGTC